MSIKGSFLCALAVTAIFSFVQAQTDSGGGRIVLPDGLKLRPHAYGHLEAGQIGQGSVGRLEISQDVSKSDKIDHIWTQDALVEFGFDAIYREHLKMAFSLGAKLYFSYPVIENARYTKNLRQDIYFDELNAQYYLGDAAMPWLLGQVGYFKFKYNPDVRNLGEYMFRTGTYPIWFDMSFDAPFQRLLGLHLQSNLFKSLKLDLLFVSATVAPAMNWSLAALANYDVAALHFINIGAGVDFAHLFDVYTNHTLPKFGGDLTTPSNFSVSYKYVKAPGDTSGWYTFKGTKIMGRIAIDPKAFIHWKYFGENDLKLYAEADLIGLENYPDTVINQQGEAVYLAPSYNERLEKMPVAVGFNVPTFKTLDVANLEVEWFGAKYYNGASDMMNQGSKPLPPNVMDYLDSTGTYPKKSQIKWSVFVKKSFFGGHFAITGQVGRDHMRLQCASYNDEMWNELLIEDKDWWWVLKTSWMF
jgi:hypothetical protein